MTTIVFHRQTATMAADRRCVNGYDTICAPVTKIRRLEDGTLVGCAGSVVALQLVCEWLEGEPTGKFDGPEKTDVLIVRPSGDVHMLQDGVMYEIEDDFPVLGSGGDIACGALAAGASAVDAIRIASRFDPFTGDGVNSLVLGQE